MILVSSPLWESELPRQLSRDVRTISNICDGNIRQIILAAKSLQPCTKTAETADLVAFTEEILNGKLCFLCSELFLKKSASEMSDRALNTFVSPVLSVHFDRTTNCSEADCSELIRNRTTLLHSYINSCSSKQLFWTLRKLLEGIHLVEFTFTSLFSWEVSENLRTHIFKENFGIVAASKLYF